MHKIALKYRCFPVLVLLILLASECTAAGFSLQDLFPKSDIPPKSDVCYLELKPAGDVKASVTCKGKLVSTVKDDHLYIWDWAKLDQIPEKVKIDSWTTRATNIVRFGALLGEDRIVTALPQNLKLNMPCIIVCRNYFGDHEYNRWDMGPDWAWRSVSYIQSSRNGKYVLVCIKERYDIVLRDKTRKDRGRQKFGLITRESSEINWFLECYKGQYSTDIHGMDISEDGKYFAGVASRNGGWIILHDIENNKTLFEKSITEKELLYGKWSVNFNDVCFSPDSKKVYVAGNTGLFCFDVSSGKLLSQWLIDGRCISVDISPDGQIVAGGNDLTGYVYLFDAKTGKMLRRILTGQYTIYGLTFSPDSKLLATSGVKNTNVKIWKMPQFETDEQK